MHAPHPQSVPAQRQSRDPTSNDEAELVAALLSGQESAWRTLHDRYAVTMHRAITRVKSRFPSLIGADDVHEIYAELWLQLLSGDKRRLRHFDPAHGTPLGVWLGVLARHAAYDFLRSCRRQPKLHWLGDELAGAESLIDDAPDAFRVCCAKERSQVTAELIAELSPRDQEFVSLYYCEGLDAEQTAQRLGICVGTVYSKKHKIRARIESLLEKRLAA